MSMEKLQGVFRGVFEDDGLRVAPETTAKDVQGWDSFNHINLIVALEEAFGVTFSSKEMADFRNVGDLVETLKKKGISISWADR